jgi:hypothetical protein
MAEFFPFVIIGGFFFLQSGKRDAISEGAECEFSAVKKSAEYSDDTIPGQVGRYVLSRGRLASLSDAFEYNTKYVTLVAERRGESDSTKNTVNVAFDEIF